MTTLGCIACNIDPQTTSMLVPLAQATIVAAPFLLRRRIVRVARTLPIFGPARRARVGSDCGSHPGHGQPETQPDGRAGQTDAAPPGA